MRTMYDSITPGNVPLWAQMVAGYVDGRYRWSEADWARFPGAVHVPIAVFASTNDGVVLDVENGNATPSQAPGWVDRRRRAGVDPSVYCSLAAWPQLRAAFLAQGIAEPHWWIAAYPGNGPQLYAGAVAHQYANPGPVDVSVVADYWPGVDPAPVSNLTSSPPPVTPVTASPVPTPLHLIPEDDMITLLRWCYTALVGREGSDVELEDWLTAAASWSTAQVVAAFDAATAEPCSHVKAYVDFLHRTPSDAEIALRAGMSIGQVRAALRTAAAAGAH